MRSVPTRSTSGELVPLADRLRYMLGFRVLAAVCVAATIPLATGQLFESRETIIAVTLAYLIAAFATHGAWRLVRRRGVALFGATLIVDGAFLAWAAYATGGAASPIRFLIVLQLLAVALLASYRTGIKLAIWQSLLVVAIYYAQKGGTLTELRATNLIGTPLQQTAVFVGVLWIVAIATAWFSAVNERELRRRRADLEALASMTARLERESEPDGVAHALVHSVVATFGFKRALLIGAIDRERFAAIAWYGDVHAGAPSGTPVTGSVLALAAQTRVTQLVSELDPSVDGWLDEMLPGARNLVFLPLTAEGRIVGGLIAEHDSRPGSRIERRLVKTVERFAAHGALALRNAWLLEEVRDLAANDPLTGLANRMTFGNALGRELARAHRDGGEVTLVMLDIDHFKMLNDSQGHQAGDEVLRKTAATLRGQQRAYDTAARYGGEEFVLIAPGLTAEDAPLTAERIRAAIEQNGCEVTASVGIATFPRDADGADSLIGAADAALYEAKHAGRNTVRQAQPSATRH